MSPLVVYKSSVSLQLLVLQALPLPHNTFKHKQFRRYRRHLLHSKLQPFDRKHNNGMYRCGAVVRFTEPFLLISGRYSTDNDHQRSEECLGGHETSNIRRRVIHGYDRRSACIGWRLMLQSISRRSFRGSKCEQSRADTRQRRIVQKED